MGRYIPVAHTHRKPYPAKNEPTLLRPPEALSLCACVYSDCDRAVAHGPPIARKHVDRRLISRGPARSRIAVLLPDPKYRVVCGLVARQFVVWRPISLAFGDIEGRRVLYRLQRR